MWWPGDWASWYEAHNSAGTTTTGTTWALADGEVGGARNVATYVLVANTSSVDGRVRATLVFEDGTTAATEMTVRANSRANFNLTPSEIAGYPEFAALFTPARHRGREALRGDRGEPGRVAGADRRGAGDVLERGRAVLGGRDQRGGDEAAVGSCGQWGALTTTHSWPAE